MHRAKELIDSVSKTTHVDAAVVRDILIESANAASERAKDAQTELGASTAYRGAQVHTPIRSSSPLAALMTAKRGAATAKVREADVAGALGVGDTSFSQLRKDIESARIAITDHARPKALSELNEACVKLIARLHQLEKSPNSEQLQAEITRLFKDMLSEGAKGKGVFLTKVDPAAGLPRVHAESPVTLPAKVSSPAREARYERLERAASVDGTPEVDAGAPTVLGHVASVGIDAATGERFLFDFHGRVQATYTLEGFVEEFRAVTEKETHRTKLIAKPESVQALRSVSDKAIERLAGDTMFVSLLEDKESAITRVYPTKWHKVSGSFLNRQVVVDGPFKGVFLDDLVNALAPTGKGYEFDPKLGPSTPITPREGEPWITSSKVRERGKLTEKLYVRIPFEKQYTPTRQALRRLSQLDPMIKYEEGSQNTGFYFPPERYKIVREILKGVVLSGSAKDKLEAYFAELTKIELAATGKSLDHHTAAAIGGFKAKIATADGRTKPVEMTHWQRKSIAMLEALGYRGVLALGTGMGKTLAAIGVMQELKEREGEKRPFLIVCPKALKGNFAKEIHKFLEPKAAKELVDRLVVVDYAQFSRAAHSGQLGGKKFAPEQFGAVFFDESQWLRNRRWKAAQAALAFDHPRKICLSASVMKDSFDDVLTQVSIAANVNLGDRTQGKELRAQARKFKLQSCVEIGGRTLGVKQETELLPGVTVDPKHDLYTWVKKHIIYADKRMDDTALPKFHLAAQTLTMPKAMEESYRKATHRLDRVLRGMVSLYRDKGVKNERIDEKGRKRVEIDPLARSPRISKVFGPKLKAAIDEINAIGNTPAKLDRAADLVMKHLEENPKSRAVLFSDSAEYVMASAKEMSKQIPGKIHAACLAKEIRLFQDGEELKTIAGHTLPFVPAAYRRDPNAPADPATNRAYSETEWQQFALAEIIGPKAEIATTTMFGPVYMEGQNLQWANVGVHLDRDTWNRQNTMQREGRLWRKDQKHEVSFYNLDWVFKKPADHLDRTLDEIRAFHEKVGGQLFDDMIVAPQETMKLGEEWSRVRPKDDLRIDFSLLRYGISPSAEKVADLEIET